MFNDTGILSEEAGMLWETLAAVGDASCPEHAVSTEQAATPQRKPITFLFITFSFSLNTMIIQRYHGSEQGSILFQCFEANYRPPAATKHARKNSGALQNGLFCNAPMPVRIPAPRPRPAAGAAKAAALSVPTNATTAIPVNIFFVIINPSVFCFRFRV